MGGVWDSGLLKIEASGVAEIRYHFLAGVLCPPWFPENNKRS